MDGGDEIICMIQSILATTAIVLVYKTFMDSDGKKRKYELHEEFSSKAAAMKEAADLRKAGNRAKYTKYGKKFRVWVAEKKSSFMKWPYDQGEGTMAELYDKDESGYTFGEYPKECGTCIHYYEPKGWRKEYFGQGEGVCRIHNEDEEFVEENMVCKFWTKSNLSSQDLRNRMTEI